jgi:hypothetical protein
LTRTALAGADAGFDAILGNPPWEGVRFKAAEFYTRFEPVFAFATTKMEKQTLADAVLSTVTGKEAFARENARLVEDAG